MAFRFLVLFAGICLCFSSASGEPPEKSPSSRGDDSTSAAITGGVGAAAELPPQTPVHAATAAPEATPGSHRLAGTAEALPTGPDAAPGETLPAAATAPNPAHPAAGPGENPAAGNTAPAGAPRDAPYGSDAAAGTPAANPEAKVAGIASEASPEAPARTVPLPAAEKAPAEDAVAAPEAGPQADPFPTFPIVEAQRAFWIEIFSRYHSREGLLHDAALTVPVYEAISLEGLSRRQQYRLVNRRKKAVAATLRELARDRETGATPDEAGQRLLGMLPITATPADLRRWARDIRFQRGLADRFKKGLIRSGPIIGEMRRILAREGVPEDLAYLPHVESSFNLRAYSKFGAAGIWQFTRGTGRMFMDVHYEVDQRLDPIIATRAAAQFLRQNHDKLKTWPLAITGYNHGPQSMERIVARTGTRNLGVMIETYNGGLFKFASKNFYAEFLAARDVAGNYRRYFGELEMAEPVVYREIQLPFFLALADAARALGLGLERLGTLNPSLRPPVLIGTKYIPRNFSLRVPAHVEPRAFLASLPEGARKDKQKPISEWLVRRGDTLYDLGRRFGITWQLIARANNITRFHRIRPGQRLIIPKPGLVLPEITVASVAAARPSRNGKVPRGSLADAIAFQRAEGDALLQDLEFRTLDKRQRGGEIVPAFGETLGHYAEWARVSTQEIRNHNGWPYGRTLRPGRALVIPLDRVNPSAFRERRVEYHQSREEDFYSTFGVTGSVKSKVRSGDSVWGLAQRHNLPMWLFYAQNPKLLEKNLRPGMEFQLPIVEPLEDLREREANGAVNGGTPPEGDAVAAEGAERGNPTQQDDFRSGNTGAGPIGIPHPGAHESFPLGFP